MWGSPDTGAEGVEASPCGGCSLRGLSGGVGGGLALASSGDLAFAVGSDDCRGIGRGGPLRALDSEADGPLERQRLGGSWRPPSVESGGRAAVGFGGAGGEKTPILNPSNRDRPVKRTTLPAFTQRPDSVRKCGNEDVFTGLEVAIGEGDQPQELPDVLDGGQLGYSGGQEEQGAAVRGGRRFLRLDQPTIAVASIMTLHFFHR